MCFRLFATLGILVKKNLKTAHETNPEFYLAPRDYLFKYIYCAPIGTKILVMKIYTACCKPVLDILKKYILDKNKGSDLIRNIQLILEAHTFNFIKCTTFCKTKELSVKVSNLYSSKYKTFFKNIIQFSLEILVTFEVKQFRMAIFSTLQKTKFN